MYICRVRPTHPDAKKVRRTHPTIIENGLVYKRVRGASGTRINFFLIDPHIFFKASSNDITTRDLQVQLEGSHSKQQACRLIRWIRYRLIHPTCMVGELGLMALVRRTHPLC